MHSFTTALVSLSLPLSALAQSYSLKTTYQGSSFFNQWNFSTAVDRNFGYVAYQSAETAQAQNLAYINSAGNAIVKVDNTTVGQPSDDTYGRASVYLLSLETLSLGSLLLFDAVHVPFGCSVWPGFFTQGSGVWPMGGEIDIFENVNQATVNQYSLHTYPSGCTAGSSTETGKIVSTDCYNNTNGNQGCIVQETQSNSYGAGFNSNGGGGYATLFDSQGIKIWFFPRASLPSDWTSDSPNPANWPSPSAFYPASSCDPTKFFTAQTINLEIDICGAYAGVQTVFSQTCPTGTCLDLLKTPSNYDEAYYEIQWMKTFTEGGNGTSGGSTTTSAKGMTTSKSGSGSPTGTGSPASSTTGAALGITASWSGLGFLTALSMIVPGLVAVLA